MKKLILYFLLITIMYQCKKKDKLENFFHLDNKDFFYMIKDKPKKYINQKLNKIISPVIKFNDSILTSIDSTYNYNYKILPFDYLYMNEDSTLIEVGFCLKNLNTKKCYYLFDINQINLIDAIGIEKNKIHYYYTQSKFKNIIDSFYPAPW